MSIRTRITFWYTGLLAISLWVFGLLLYSLLTGILLAVTDDRLSGQAQNVASLIRAENDPVSVMLSGQAKLPPIEVFASQYYVQIIQLDGKTVQLSDNLRGQRMPLPQEALDAVVAGETHSYTIQAAEGVRIRVFAMPILLGTSIVGGVEVAQSLADLDASLAAMRRVLILGSLTTLLLASSGGVLLSRAALRPIEAITDTARRIAATQDLAERIPIAVPNDELGRLTSTINDMLAKLESLFQGQQRLVADVSHELRTPMTTIQGNLDLLMRGAADDPKMLAESLTAIGDETTRMRLLVNDLLLLAQADAGLYLHPQPVEMDTLLLDVYRQAQVMAQNVNVRLGGEDQAVVSGDRDRLRQLLLNLTDNAIKYTPPGGEVRLTLKRTGGWVEISVEDNGMGISPEDLPHIFERFYRADRSRTRPGGSGLGLAIAKWVAEAHGGRIDVESHMGVGSIFTVWLPELPMDQVTDARDWQDKRTMQRSQGVRPTPTGEE